MMSEELPNVLRKWVHGAVYLGAIAWPWGAYEQVFHGQGVFSAALLALLLAFVVSWFRHGRPNIPFDVLWPVLLLNGGVAVAWGTGEGAAAPGIIIGCAAFLLALFGATSQTLVYRALAASLLSSGGVAVLTALAEFNKVFPSFFARQGGVVGTGPTNLVDALTLFSWSVMVAGVLFVGRRHLLSRTVSWLLPIVALACGAAFYLVARHLHNELRVWTPNYSALAFPMFPLLLLSFYLASRVAARVFVLAGFRLFCPETLLGLALLFFILVFALIGRFPSPGLCFSFGLVAALGVQHTFRNRETAKIGWVWLLLVPVLVAHAVLVFPGDARDYVRHAQQLKQEEGIQAAGDYLGLVLNRFPGESRARLELAGTELENGQVEAATDSFLASMRDRRATHVWGAPGSGEAARFLATLKLRSDGMPGIPYERCLAGVGRMQEALSVLRTRVHAGPNVDMDSAPLRRALISLMGGDETGPCLSDWSAAELLGGLNLCGTYCQTVQAPTEIPRRFLPMVLAARPVHDGRMVSVFYPGGQLGRSWHMPSCSGETPGEGESLWLEPVLDADTGEWYLPLGGVADIAFGDEMRVFLTEDTQRDCGPGAGNWAVICLLP